MSLSGWRTISTRACVRSWSRRSPSCGRSRLATIAFLLCVGAKSSPLYRGDEAAERKRGAVEKSYGRSGWFDGRRIEGHCGRECQGPLRRALQHLGPCDCGDPQPDQFGADRLALCRAQRRRASDHPVGSNACRRRRSPRHRHSRTGGGDEIAEMARAVEVFATMRSRSISFMAEQEQAAVRLEKVKSSSARTNSHNRSGNCGRSARSLRR